MVNFCPYFLNVASLDLEKEDKGLTIYQLLDENKLKKVSISSENANQTGFEFPVAGQDFSLPHEGTKAGCKT